MPDLVKQDHASESASGERTTTLRDVPAVSRAIAILRALNKADSPQSLSTIARDLRVIPSTCLHILRVLVAEGLVAFNKDTKKYSTSSGILSLSSRVRHLNSFPEMCIPHLHDISASYGITALATDTQRLEGATVVAISRSERLINLHVDVGSRFPALTSASGRCVAAFGNFSEHEIARRFKDARWDNPPAYKDWRAEVELGRAIGYAVDEGKYAAGVSILAAPVFMPDGNINCLVAMGFRDEMQRIGYSIVGEDLKTRAASIRC